MFNTKVEGASYFWARIGLANITLCPVHKKEAMLSLIKSIKEKYSL